MFGPELGMRCPESGRSSPSNCRATGRTADIDRPLSYEAMAEDIAAHYEVSSIERGDVMGYSLGGGVALQTAIRHPALGASSSSSRLPASAMDVSEVLAAMAQMGPAAASK